MPKYFVRVDKGVIIDAFSDAHKEPLESDICVHSGDNLERHFSLDLFLSGYPGIYKYKYVEGSGVVERTEEDTLIERQNEAWNRFRYLRKDLLRDTDWTQLPDVALKGRLTSEQISAWADYRQALADIPNNQIDPFNIIWPIKPS